VALSRVSAHNLDDLNIIRPAVSAGLCVARKSCFTDISYKSAYRGLQKETTREDVMEVTRPESIVEVSVVRAGVSRAVGIMSMRQALELPDIPDLSYSHPDPAKAAAGIALSRKDLQGLLIRH
jgi:hypothetical protein